MNANRAGSFLALLSVAWAGSLLFVPSLLASAAAMTVTAGLLLVNFAFSAWLLIRQGRVLLRLGLAQLLLFGFLHAQVFRMAGPEHYSSVGDPGWLDWGIFLFAHAARAVDFLDILETYGINLQTIHHSGKLSATLLVLMHFQVDLFVIAALLSRIPPIPDDRRNKPDQDKEKKGMFFICLTILFEGLAVAIGFAWYQGWAARDWFLWPLDNVLRTLDVADVFQMYDWQLHGVEMGFWTKSLAIALRLVVGLLVADWLYQLRLTKLAGWGVTLQDRLQWLAEGKPEVRRAMISSLGNLQVEPADVVPGLVMALADEDGDVQKGAIELLYRHGPGLVPELVQALATGAGKQQRMVAVAQALKSPMPPIRAAAAVYLGRCGQAAQVAMKELTSAVGDKELCVRKAVVETLGKVGKAAASATSALVPLLADPDWRLRRGTAHALGAIGPEAKEAIPALVQALTDREPNAAEEAAGALGLLGPAALVAIPELEKAVQNSPFWEVRARAAETLGQMGPSARSTVPTLIQALAGPKKTYMDTILEGDMVPPDTQLKAAAAQALGNLREPAPTIVPALVQALKDRFFDVRWNAAEALGKLGPAAAQATAALVDKLAVRDWCSTSTGLELESVQRDVRWQVAESLGKIGPAACSALGALRQAQQAADCQKLRQKAATAIRKIESGG